MPTPRNPEDDFLDDPAKDDEADEKEEVVAGGRCPICEMLAGECDHLVASIDLTCRIRGGGHFCAGAGHPGLA
jgi:hypothetical protein